MARSRVPLAPRSLRLGGKIKSHWSPWGLGLFIAAAGLSRLIPRLKNEASERVRTSSQPVRDEGPGPSTVGFTAHRVTAADTRAFTGQSQGRGSAAHAHLGAGRGRPAVALLGPQRSPREAVLPATPSCFPCGGQAIAPKSASRLTHCPGRTWGHLFGAGRGPSKGTNGSSSLLSRASSGERLRSGDTRTASRGGPPPARRRQPGRETGRPLPSPYTQPCSGLRWKVQPTAPWAARRQRRRTVPFLEAKMTRRQGLHLQAQRSAMVPREQ